MEAPKIYTQMRENAGRILAAGGIAAGSILGIGAAEVAVDTARALPAAAWEFDIHAKPYCDPAPDTLSGNAFENIEATNTEMPQPVLQPDGSTLDQNAMNVTPYVITADGHKFEGDTELLNPKTEDNPNPTKWHLGTGGAPQERPEEIGAVTEWVDAAAHNFQEPDVFKVDAEELVPVDSCPPPTTTTTEAPTTTTTSTTMPPSTSTTSTTTPESTTTITESTTTTTTTPEKPPLPKTGPEDLWPLGFALVTGGTGLKMVAGRKRNVR